MATIKRRLKKRITTQSTVTSPAKSVPAFEMSGTGLGLYRLPRCGEMPPGNYYSEVIHATYVTTKAGDKAVKVYYTLMDAIDCYQVANNIRPADTVIKKHYVIQVYPYGSTPYLDFTDSMAEALGLGYGVSFSLEDIIGVTEYVTLSFTSKGGIGGFDSRAPFKWSDFKRLSKNQTVSDDEDEPGDYEEDYEDCDW